MRLGRWWSYIGTAIYYNLSTRQGFLARKIFFGNQIRSSIFSLLREKKKKAAARFLCSVDSIINVCFSSSILAALILSSIPKHLERASTQGEPKPILGPVLNRFLKYQRLPMSDSSWVSEL
ncbi:hypothetical protein AVEN_227929-1 [Araneus ventricosus]|uniref:Uncharacterized protein n=1 Tax=Araneus ventricosus TaxID=182803 RepID=A0A4Y2MMS1_ARAVE|nr:hypothetical protein AVEN_259439-1 [Araneus ventricosus]GBN27989.1 hypothetical protein AVEN_4374-1 [Araneus ventricosus]GBN31151.1 hypothetical protein AVEN_236678-1 [Araneus ventricosus]GBN31159.1 hypothetical protein AVEN_227929-1 [Araneus ventricosus]